MAASSLCGPLCPDLGSLPRARCRSRPPPAFRGFLNGITFDLATTYPLVFDPAYAGLGFICVYRGTPTGTEAGLEKLCAAAGSSRSRLPFRATMLRLLRLPCSRPSHDENSRNPALWASLTLISPILFIVMDRPCSLHCAPARSCGPQTVFRSCEICSCRRKPSCPHVGTKSLVRSEAAGCRR